MFDRIKEIINNSKKLNETQLLIFVFTDRKVKDSITDYITNIQLFKEGEDGLGNKLQEYTPFTKLLKQEKGQPFDRTTLKDTGQFYASFRVVVNNAGEVKVIANDVNDLTEKYGKNILTLSYEGIEEIKPQIIKLSQRYIRETLSL